MYPVLYHKKRRRWFLAGLLIFAMGLRLWMEPALLHRAGDRLLETLRSPRLLQAALFLETGTRLSQESLRAFAPEEETDPGPETAPWSGPPETSLPPEPSAAEPPQTSAGTEASAPETARPETPEPFTEEEAERITLRGNCSYRVDKAALLVRPLDWEIRPGPKVLIIHTHSCESYTPSEGHEYTSDGNYRTLDLSASVIAVGDALAEALGELGVEVIHDRTYNDYPSYNGSYSVAREKIQRYLEQYPSIVMVLDVHRDAMEPPVRETARVDGETCAALMLVIGTDEGGLSHPDWQDNLSCGLKLQALANRSCPGLFKAISFRKERFNGDLTPGSLIVEVGSTGNVLPEALAAMPPLARTLRELLSCAGIA